MDGAATGWLNNEVNWGDVVVDGCIFGCVGRTGLLVDIFVVGEVIGGTGAETGAEIFSTLACFVTAGYYAII